MRLNTLVAVPGSRKVSKRLGRGTGSGLGKTAGKGHKGQKARSGIAIKAFEGGQMPLQRRVPKFGFKNINRVEYRGINLDVIQGLVDDNNVTAIDLAFLISKGLAHKNDKVKVLGRGELKSKVDIQVHAFSATAKSAIEAKGGSAVSVEKVAKA